MVMPKGMSGLENVEQVAKRKVRKLRYYNKVETTDPFGIGVMRGVDVVSLSGVNIMDRVWREYKMENGIEGESRGRWIASAVYEGEARALRYERRMGELRLRGDILHRDVVMGLERWERTEVYLKALASGEIVGRPMMGIDVVIDGQRFELMRWEDVQRARVPWVIAGMFGYAKWKRNDIVNKMKARYDDVGRWANTWMRWEREGYRALMSDLANEDERKAVRDLLVVGRLLIRDELARRSS